MYTSHLNNHVTLATDVYFIHAVVSTKSQQSSDISSQTSSPSRATGSSEQSTVRTADPLSVRFSTFVATIEALLDKKCRNKLKQSKRFCSNLTISDSSDELLFNDEQLQKIKACSTFSKLFVILRKHWSWKDYSILTHIISITGLKKAKAEAELFEKRMASYQGMKIISEKISPDNIPQDYIRLKIIIDKPYQELSLQNFTELRKFIFSNLDVNQYIALPFIKFLFSSLHLEWYVLKKAASHMIKMAKQNEEIFMNNSVVFIQIDQSVVLDSTPKDKEHMVSSGVDIRLPWREAKPSSRSLKQWYGGCALQKLYIYM